MNEGHILEEIYQNANTTLYSLNTLLPKVGDHDIYTELTAHKGTMEDIASRAEQMMLKRRIAPEANSVKSKMNIWAGIQWNTMMDSSASHIAEIVIQGDTMGITSMTKEMNNNPTTDEDIRDLGEKLINSERRNIETLKKYL